MDLAVLASEVRRRPWMSAVDIADFVSRAYPADQVAPVLTRWLESQVVLRPRSPRLRGPRSPRLRGPRSLRVELLQRNTIKNVLASF
jgi:hypothetical protein